jgi:hypothetical protein
MYLRAGSGNNAASDLKLSKPLFQYYAVALLRCLFTEEKKTFQKR